MKESLSCNEYLIQNKDNKIMGAKMPAPRNPLALAGIWLRGAAPITLGKWGVGTADSSQSPTQIQGRGTGHAARP